MINSILLMVFLIAGIVGFSVGFIAILIKNNQRVLNIILFVTGLIVTIISIWMIVSGSTYQIQGLVSDKQTVNSYQEIKINNTWYSIENVQDFLKIENGAIISMEVEERSYMEGTWRTGKLIQIISEPPKENTSSVCQTPQNKTLNCICT